MFRELAGFAVLLAASFAVAAQAQKSAGDWPMYRHDPASTGYSDAEADQHRRTSRQLAQAWTMRLNDRGGLEVTPIAVNGVMYLPAGNKVLAVDPVTGKEIWHYDVAASQASSRGVAYWPGDGTNAPRIIFTTFDRKLIALDAATGKLVPTLRHRRNHRTDRRLQRSSHDLQESSLCWAPASESCPRDLRATRAPTTRSPASWSGRFTPSPDRVKRATKPGSTTAGRAAPARTSGAGT